LDGKDAWNEWAKEHEGWSVDFKGIDFKEYLTTQSEVDKKATLLFEDFTFPGSVDFRNTIFARDVNFNRIRVLGTFDASDSTFYKNVSFCGAFFHADTKFVSTIFSGNADFSDADLGNCPTFFSAVFKGDACFSNANFYNGGTFDCAEFRARADLNFREGSFVHHDGVPEFVSFLSTVFKIKGEGPYKR
ncbi:MAG: hypothetical protein GXP16_18130, partial [Gammaproteobacteria bacterium]|nr:hypothetical protein [Gammaproteobacteria bacterium]